MKVRIKAHPESSDTMAGMGPFAWDRDTQKMSMHPPLPENIEHVERDMENHHEKHHRVQRRHPELGKEDTAPE